MRIANTTIARNYTRTINDGLSRLNNLSSKVYSGAKFSSMAEDTASGIRAFDLRKSLSRLESSRDNAKHAMSTFEAAEKSLSQISSMSTDVQGLFVQAMNPESDVEHSIIANQLEKIQEQMLSIFNGQFSDLYMFGGTNTKERPFDFSNGTLKYNGKDVTDADPLNESVSYIDIGLGLTLNPDGSANPNSAFQSSISGLDVAGRGEDNIILRLDKMIKALRTPGFDATVGGDLLNNFLDSANSTRAQITRLGADYSYLEFHVSRMDEEKINLTSRLDDVQIIDPAQAIMDFEMQQYVYNAALQMGSRILQPTLFSFLN